MRYGTAGSSAAKLPDCGAGTCTVRCHVFHAVLLRTSGRRVQVLYVPAYRTVLRTSCHNTHMYRRVNVMAKFWSESNGFAFAATTEATKSSPSPHSRNGWMTASCRDLFTPVRSIKTHDKYNQTRFE